ncbi:DUF6973 domain-containing protein [Dyadobacter sp. CY326]|uniref:DUF6973 domain-containing protein n=1 Tax=Dyadobacter sp. CY326 TaxID=2907300 RepID=UPI001F30AF69|nr:hypothetical protein [Dyadobacter sp. CY326]MCE7065682.1 hypothetical protein [Dyadobacter sp. CY326]
MKLNLRNVLVFTFFGFAISSCDRPGADESVAPEIATEIIAFKGERVVVPANFPKELFGQTQEEFDNYYERLSQIKHAKTSGEYAGITYEELLPILVKHNANYPVITSEEGILEKDLERVFRDFPDIETHEEANEKRGLIYDYYQTLCKRDVVAEVIALERLRNARTAGPSPGSLTTPEKNHLLLNPGYAQHYIQAANDVNFLTPNIYNNDKDGNNANAFKHSTWNALSIRYILKGSPASENQAVDFTQDGTSKHEMNDDGSQNQIKIVAMDLHNNMSAREWMANETSWGFGPFRKIPSVDDIIATMITKANSSAVHPLIDILNLAWREQSDNLE